MNSLKSSICVSACVLLLSAPGIAGENNNKKVGIESFSNTTVAFQQLGNFKNISISVAGPNGYYARQFKSQGSPALNLTDFGGLADGLYTYEISVATNKTRPTQNTLNNGRGSKTKATENIGETQSGSFRVEGGVIVKKPDLSEG